MKTDENKSFERLKVKKAISIQKNENSQQEGLLASATLALLAATTTFFFFTLCVGYVKYPAREDLDTTVGCLQSSTPSNLRKLQTWPAQTGLKHTTRYSR